MSEALSDGAGGRRLVEFDVEDGLVLRGFRVSENTKTLVLREPAGGKEIKLDKSALLSQTQAKVSAMPPGLVNQLANRKQFLDLVRFLMEVNERGPSRMMELKKAVGGK